MARQTELRKKTKIVLIEIPTFEIKLIRGLFCRLLLLLLLLLFIYLFFLFK